MMEELGELEFYKKSSDFWKRQCMDTADFLCKLKRINDEEINPRSDKPCDCEPYVFSPPLFCFFSLLLLLAVLLLFFWNLELTNKLKKTEVRTSKTISLYPEIFRRQEFQNIYELGKRLKYSKRESMLWIDQHDLSSGRSYSLGE